MYTCVIANPLTYCLLLGQTVSVHVLRPCRTIDSPAYYICSLNCKSPHMLTCVFVLLHSQLMLVLKAHTFVEYCGVIHLAAMYLTTCQWIEGERVAADHEWYGREQAMNGLVTSIEALADGDVMHCSFRSAPGVLSLCIVLTVQVLMRSYIHVCSMC